MRVVVLLRFPIGHMEARAVSDLFAFDAILLSSSTFPLFVIMPATWFALNDNGKRALVRCD
jgi:hypothetical protein